MDARALNRMPLDDLVQITVAAAPPLSAEQRVTLAAILGPANQRVQERKRAERASEAGRS